VSLSRDGRRLLTQLALHLETGFRLRHRPESLQAVIARDGRVLHREDAALPTTLLREQVARIESARQRRRRATADAIDLWSALVAGRFSLVARTEGWRRHYLVVENAPLTQPIRALTRGELDAVSAAARGLSTKLVSYGLGVSRSVISSRLASAATKIGVATRIELVRIAAMLTRDPRARFADIALTATEKDVFALLAQGLSNREIAVLRNRSMRTIANQVAQLLRKSKAHSRQALVARLVERSGI
jgi:DNA-binding NarL/FixJ family response regulator